MTAWTADELARIDRAEEIGLASQRQDGSLRSFTTMWVVRCGDDVYVRSAYGPSNGWFVRALASGGGRIRAGGVERDVTFEEPGPAVDAAVHAAYHAKYDRYGPKIVGTVVSSDAARCTLRLVPRQASEDRPLPGG
jgi:hypothetical protein